MSETNNEIIYEDGFLRDVRKMPRVIQDKLAFLLDVFRDNPFDSRLHTKQLSYPLKNIYSLRITRDYRAGFIFMESHKIKLLVADKRDQIYKRLKRKI